MTLTCLLLTFHGIPVPPHIKSPRGAFLVFPQPSRSIIQRTGGLPTAAQGAMHRKTGPVSATPAKSFPVG